MNRLFQTVPTASALNAGLLILRIGVGLAMLTHGLPKLSKLLDGNMAFGDPIGLGAGTSLVLTVFAEVICSVLILLGAATRLATIPLIITMLVALLVVHASDPFGEKELPFFYLLIYIVLFLVGSGRHSVDWYIRKKK